MQIEIEMGAYDNLTAPPRAIRDPRESNFEQPSPGARRAERSGARTPSPRATTDQRRDSRGLTYGESPEDVTFKEGEGVWSRMYEGCEAVSTLQSTDD